ncbi:MAG TPA: sulfatase-like hydrolase/transferase, partial [Caldilinea sp.]|nr:sulfatase-like hydrolase/transferase [Caldilinea sp.]
KLVDDLKRLGIYDDTVIIVSADHGENQGELNIWGDHQTADHITNRVPLIVRWPGVTDGQAGGVRNGLHYHLDLPATLADLLGGSQPEAWDGASFARDLAGSTDNGRDYLVISQGAWSCQRAVRWENWLLIRTYHTGLKDFPAYMLFDIEADPHETTNLAAARPDVLGEGLCLLDEWVGAQMYRSQRGDPFWGVIAEGGPLHAKTGSASWDAYLARLRASGRTHHAEALDRYGGRPVRSGLES